MTQPDILSFFVGTPRAGQAKCLPAIEREWDRADVFVIRADVGEGKSKIAECVTRWVASKRTKTSAASGMIVVPNNVLLDQYLQGTRGFDTLRRQDSYMCVQHAGLSCMERRDQVGGCCRSPSGNHYARGACPYLRDLRKSRSSDKMVMTYHGALGNKLVKDVLCADEAHQLLPFLREMQAVRLWKHAYHFPTGVDSVESAVSWLENNYRGAHDEKTDLLYETLTGPRPQFMVDFSPQDWRGQARPCISLIPLDVRDQAAALWPNKVRKVILMSATIGRLDVEALGLARRRVTYIDLPSSIPPENRPIHFVPVADMRFASRARSAPTMARWLLEEFLPAHRGEKGLIHATYEVARLLREAAASQGGESARRLRFHGRGDKRAVLEQFMTSDPADGAVLVGSGMYEGLDLAGDLARFQVLTAVPRKSVGDPAVAWLAENEPETYEWETVRDLVQATGRVCRGAEDYGLTVIADSSFGEREINSPQLPQSWRDALIINP